MLHKLLHLALLSALVLSASLLLVPAVTQAQGPIPLDDYNPAPGSPEDNECNPGGTMHGYCETEEHWTCGWNLARYNRNVISYEQLPPNCRPGSPSFAGSNLTCFRENQKDGGYFEICFSPGFDLEP